MGAEICIQNQAGLINKIHSLALLSICLSCLVGNWDFSFFLFLTREELIKQHICVVNEGVRREVGFKMEILWQTAIRR